MEGKHIILAVTGSIAAYKAAYLTRLLRKAGCNVQVLMTPSAQEFVRPVTFATLSQREVFSNVISADQWNNHVELGLWADAMVCAPATANTIAKCAHGIADNMVVATYLSARCPVFFAPAMDLDMWQHATTRENLAALQRHGDRIIPVGHGELASGLTGDGRMAEPEEIVAYLARYFESAQELAGKRVLVTAGPTEEPIDPVRFLGNPSTGKMGIAVAEALSHRGAQVDLVLGPTHLRPDNGINCINVRTSGEMLEASSQLFDDADIAVFAAAVADYKTQDVAEEKIKKSSSNIRLELVPTEDIALELSKRKKASQVTVGFALETENAERNATEKLQKKKFDLIVLNSLKDEGAGFGHDTNKVKFIYANSEVRAFNLKSKKEVAGDIAAAIVSLINK